MRIAVYNPKGKGRCLVTKSGTIDGTFISNRASQEVTAIGTLRNGYTYTLALTRYDLDQLRATLDEQDKVLESDA